jgi:hypothetical protein
MSVSVCDCAGISAEERHQWEQRRAERMAYQQEWIERQKAKAAAEPADAVDDDPDEIAAKLPALERLRRDVAYRLPTSGKPLGNIVLTRGQAIELLALCGCEIAIEKVQQ